LIVADCLQAFKLEVSTLQRSFVIVSEQQRFARGIRTSTLGNSTCVVAKL
jgi:hypothetical protein